MCSEKENWRLHEVWGLLEGIDLATDPLKASLPKSLGRLNLDGD